jgi:hemerythrin superfamily protein
MGTLPRFSLFRDRNWEERMADEYTDAIALLKADHRTVENLFATYEKARGQERKRKLAEEICNELKIHTMIEEEIFYPALKGKIEDELLQEAYVEHDGAKLLINDIVAGSPDEEFYDAKVKVLQEQIEHHVKEEERPSEGLFSQARDTDADLVALRDAMLKRKQALMAQAEAGGLPAARPSVVETA